jgi:hypothetical protein
MKTRLNNPFNIFYWVLIIAFLLFVIGIYGMNAS